MKARIVRIGNSTGLWLPKSILKLVGLDKEVEIQIRGGSIVLKKPMHPRSGWAKALRAMAKGRDDVLLDFDTSMSSWDEEEWQWR